MTAFSPTDSRLDTTEYVPIVNSVINREDENRSRAEELQLCNTLATFVLVRGIVLSGVLLVLVHRRDQTSRLEVLGVRLQDFVERDILVAVLWVEHDEVREKADRLEVVGARTRRRLVLAYDDRVRGLYDALFEQP